jgi:hypothetical protein
MRSYREHCISEDLPFTLRWITAADTATATRDLRLYRFNYNWSDWRTTWP